MNTETKGMLNGTDAVFVKGAVDGRHCGRSYNDFSSRPKKTPLQSEQLPATRGRPAVACSRILDHEPKPAVGDEIPHA